MSDISTTKGAGLARGPALILGTVLLAFALAAMVGHSDFPSVRANFPDGDVTGTTFLVFEVNGWTNWLLAACGGALLFGSAQHLLAKTFSLVVGLVLAAAAVLGLVTGDILGLGASNAATWIGMAAAAGVLLLNLFAPRRTHEAETARTNRPTGYSRSDDDGTGGPVPAPSS